jgi:capsular polysaccharide transport system permease protein
MNQWRQALLVQGRVIYALILRESLTKYGKTKLGYLWAILEPIVQLTILILVFSFLGRKSPIGGDLALFFTTGIIPFNLFRNIANRSTGALGSNQALLAYPHVTPLDVLISRSLLEAGTMLLVFILILVGFKFIGKEFSIYDLYNVMMGFLVLIIFSFGLGLIYASIKIYIESWDKIISSLNRPLFFLSGVFFTASMIPYEVRKYLIWNPIFQSIEWIRSGFFSSHGNEYLNISYTVSCAIFTLFLGLFMITVNKHKARRL